MRPARGLPGGIKPRYRAACVLVDAHPAVDRVGKAADLNRAFQQIRAFFQHVLPCDRPHVMDPAVVRQRRDPCILHMAQIRQHAAVFGSSAFADLPLDRDFKIFRVVAGGKGEMPAVLVHHLCAGDPLRQRRRKEFLPACVAQDRFSFPNVTVEDVCDRVGKADPDLHEFHIDQLGARFKRHSVSVAGHVRRVQILFKNLAAAACRQHDRPRTDRKPRAVGSVPPRAAATVPVL